MTKTRVLFVCLGNICRSPMAEGLFVQKVNEAGLAEYFDIDSAGTADYHVGERPDPRMLKTAEDFGVHLPSLGRQIEIEDLDDYDYILAMDKSNQRNIESLLPQGNYSARIHLMRDFDPLSPGTEVPDPYYGGDQGFVEVYKMLDRSTAKLLESIREEKNI